MSTDQLILTQVPKRLSRDEMNLAEFPLTVLSTRSNPKTKTLEFSDSVKNKNGELIDRKWIITGADKFGLPTASDDEVLLGLLKLSVESGMRNPKVYFTRYEILKTLRWTTEGRSYTRLQKALDRLSGVRIKATNAFYDNETKLHSTKNFGIVDAYEINDGREGENKQSFFIWSEVLFKSFQVGFIKKLDLEFYLNLKSAITKRIYRFLDKHFWYRTRVQMNLFSFAHEKIGVSRNYRYTSSIRQQLDPAFEELIQQGFIGKVEYFGKGSDAELAIHAARSKPRSQLQPGEEEAPRVNLESNPPQISLITTSRAGQFSSQAAQTELLPPSGLAELIEALVERGIARSQAERLLSGRSPELLPKIKRIIAYVDNLRATGSPRVQRSPVGFLYRAVEKADSFTLPGEDSENRSYQNSVQVNENSRKDNAESGTKDEAILQSRYLVERKRALSDLKSNVEEKLLENISQEVRSALTRLSGLISEKRFEEAVAHGIEERLAKLFALPDFTEWRKKNAA